MATIANQGLPDYYGLPNHTTMAAIYERVDAIKCSKEEAASSFEELGKMFEEG